MESLGQNDFSIVEAMLKHAILFGAVDLNKFFNGDFFWNKWFLGNG